MGKDISLNEIGCSLSHQKIYKKIVDENLDGAFIFEDDAYTCKDIKKIITTIYRNKDKFLQKNWLVMSRSYINTRRKIFKIDDNYSVYKGIRIRYTDAYYIDRLGAEMLLDLNTPIKYVADWFKGGYINKLNITALDKACNVQNTQFESGIDENRNNTYDKSLLFKVKEAIKKIYFYRFDMLRLFGVVKKATRFD